MIGWVGFGLQIWGWVLKKMTCAQLRLRTWYITALWNGSGPNFTKIHIPLPGMPSRCRGLMITNAKTGTGSGNARGKRTDGRKCMPDYCFQRTPPPPPPARPLAGIFVVLATGSAGRRWVITRLTICHDLCHGLDSVRQPNPHLYFANDGRQSAVFISD